MKICVVGLDQASPEVIFQDERLLNLRRLADAGLYGLLAAANVADPWKSFEASQSPVSPATATLWTALTDAGQNVVVLPSEGANGAVLSKQQLFDASQHFFTKLKESLAGQENQGVCYVDRGLSVSSSEDAALISEYYLWLDEQIGGLMEALDDQTVLLLFSAGKLSEPGFFVLVSPNCPISGEHEGATVLDLAPTVLDLAGSTIPASMHGRSLVAGMEKRIPSEEDHEKIIYDRLAGLGYV